MPEERNVRLLVEYDGTDFSGWQRQASDPTVQQQLEDALATMTGHVVLVRGAGRTDAGVHARGQVASFRTGARIPLRGLVKGVNSVLPRTIAVVSAEEAPQGFEPRHWATGKHYAYRIWNRDTRAALLDRYSWHLYEKLDERAMAEAASVLVGEHDFSAFRAADCDRRNPVRVMRRVEVHREGDLVLIDVEGTAFLKHMVRVIAGTLAEVGHGKRTVAQVAAALASRDRGQAGRTAPAKGLTLEQVFMGDGPRKSPAAAVDDEND